MKTVLFITFSSKYRNRDRLDGVCRYIKEHRLNWRVHVAEFGDAAPNVTDIVKLWHPIGCIVESGGGTLLRFPGEFADSTPIVYLDGNPNLCDGDNTLCVLSDSNVIAVAAAKELLCWTGKED